MPLLSPDGACRCPNVMVVDEVLVVGAAKVLFVEGVVADVVFALLRVSLCPGLGRGVSMETLLGLMAELKTKFALQRQ